VPALLVAVVTLVAAAVPAAAVQSDLTIFLDFDNDATTGCNDLASGFQGYNQKVVTTVDTTTGPNSATVTQIQGFDCSNTLIFDNATLPPPPSPPPHPVGIGNGDLGLNVVETFWRMVPFSPPPAHPCPGGSQGRCLRLGVYAQNANGGSDELFTTDGTPTGPPILVVVNGTVEIPTLSEWGLLLLTLLLAGAAAFKLRRRPLRALLTVVLVLCAGGVAFAVLGDLDGTTIGEWGPLAPAPNPVRVAHDSSATDDGDDIASLYARSDVPAQRVWFRIDASLVFNQAPEASDDVATVVEDSGANT